MSATPALLEQLARILRGAASRAAVTHPLAVYLSLLLAIVFLAAFAIGVTYRLKIARLHHRERIAALAVLRDLRVGATTGVRIRPLLELLSRRRD